jgi:hypothetical protein
MKKEFSEKMNRLSGQSETKLTCREHVQNGGFSVREAEQFLVVAVLAKIWIQDGKGTTESKKKKHKIVGSKLCSKNSET